MRGSMASQIMASHFSFSLVLLLSEADNYANIEINADESAFMYVCIYKHKLWAWDPYN